MDKAIKRTNSRTRTIALTGLSIALVAISAWIIVPIGPVPFTLQMLSITLVICTLRPTEAIAAIYGYVILGSLGVPVFSGMRAGIGVLLGPTGGFLVGYLIGVPLAVGFLHLARKTISKDSSSDDVGKPNVKTNVFLVIANISAGLIFTAISYITGCVQYTFVGGVDIAFAFAVAIAPFIIPDVIKVVIAAISAVSINRALGK